MKIQIHDKKHKQLSSLHSSNYSQKTKRLLNSFNSLTMVDHTNETSTIINLKKTPKEDSKCYSKTIIKTAAILFGNTQYSSKQILQKNDIYPPNNFALILISKLKFAFHTRSSPHYDKECGKNSIIQNLIISIHK